MNVHFLNTNGFYVWYQASMVNEIIIYKYIMTAYDLHAIRSYILVYTVEEADVITKYFHI